MTSPLRPDALPAAAASPAAKFASIGSPYFGIMLAFMAVVLILSNIGASKGVAIGPIITDGGFFLFPLAYILGDVISEVYGFRMARKAIFLIFCSIAASVIGITDFGMFVNYVVVGFVYKTLVEFLFVPVTSLVIGWIKKREPSYGV